MARACTQPSCPHRNQSIRLASAQIRGDELQLVHELSELALVSLHTEARADIVIFAEIVHAPRDVVLACNVAEVARERFNLRLR